MLHSQALMSVDAFYLDLPLHSDAEEHDEVHYKYRPEHWHIEGIEKCANHGDDDAFCCRMPAKKNYLSENICEIINAKFVK